MHSGMLVGLSSLWCYVITGMRTVSSGCKQIYWVGHLFVPMILYKFIGSVYHYKCKMKGFLLNGPLNFSVLYFTMTD